MCITMVANQANMIRTKLEHVQYDTQTSGMVLCHNRKNHHGTATFPPVSPAPPHGAPQSVS